MNLAYDGVMVHDGKGDRELFRVSALKATHYNA